MAGDLVTTNAAEIAALMQTATQNVTAALKGEADRLKRDILADYKRTTATWSHSVQFEAITDTAADGSFSLLVGTDDAVYGYVDAGTRAHIITPKRAKRLRFQWGGPGSYRPKTVAGVIGSTTGGASGPLVYRQLVHHPGTKARHFTRDIFEKRGAESMKRITERLRNLWGR